MIGGRCGAFTLVSISLKPFGENQFGFLEASAVTRYPTFQLRVRRGVETRQPARMSAYPSQLGARICAIWLRAKERPTRQAARLASEHL